MLHLQTNDSLQKGKSKVTIMETSSKFWKYSILLLVLVLIICSFPILFTKLPVYVADFSNTGQIGDTIGGIIGPFVAIIASGLTFIAFWVQYEANERQRRDISLERFENTLFQLIQIQESITNNLHYTPQDGADKLYGNSFTGRHVFDVLYCSKTYFYDINSREYGLQDAIKRNGISAYEDDLEIRRLDHYFRHLYGIFKYIDEVNILDFPSKYRYANIVTAGMSQYELIFLFYYGLSNGHNDFKKLIEKYALLENLHIDFLATEKERSLYKYKMSAMEKSNGNTSSPNEYERCAFRISYSINSN